jgi:hypothetical protein
MSYAASEEYEGMGRLGNKTEIVSTQEPEGGIARGGIFEIRAGQTQSLDYTEWRGFAKDVAEFLLFMQPDAKRILEGNERNRRMMQGGEVRGSNQPRPTIPSWLSGAIKSKGTF